jgi:acyl dehydratase
MSEGHELRVTPDKYLPFRYAGASGDFNPIHLDAELAKAVGFPSNILHGLWSMAQVARAAVEAGGGDPRSLRRLSVQFRGIGLPEEEIVVTATPKQGGALDLVARQGDRDIVKNAEAELAR